MANSLGGHQESIERSFKSFEERSLNDAREGRSEIQTDILNHKTAISARIDSLENEVLALKGTIQGFDEKISDTGQRGGEGGSKAPPLYRGWLAGVGGCLNRRDRPGLIKL